MDRRIVLAAAAAISVGLVACGSSTGTPSASGSAAGPTATATSSGGSTNINVAVSTTGAVTEKGTFTFGAFANGASKPCSQFTAAADNSFYVSALGTVAGQRFLWTIAVTPYSGPRTYLLSNDLPMQVEVDAASETEPFQAPTGPMGPDGFTMTTKADGSGTFVFTNWPDQTMTGPGSRLESGTITWTCSQS